MHPTRFRVASNIQGRVNWQDFTATRNDLANAIGLAVIFQTQEETTIGFHAKFEITNEITMHLYQITMHYNNYSPLNLY